MVQTTRKHHRSLQRATQRASQSSRHHKRRGGSRGSGGTRITFRNNTKPPTKNNYSHLPNSYLDELREVLETRMAPVSETHANNAQIIAEIQNSYNDPADMKEALRLIYAPEKLTPEETAVARSLLTKGLLKGIDRVAIAPLKPETRQKILNYFRYAQAMHKIKHIYEKEHKPKFIHAEWNSQ